MKITSLDTNQLEVILIIHFVKNPVVRRRKKNPDLKRVNKQTILFNNFELNAIENYCNRFRIKNRTRFMREIIITEILKKFNDNYPTLFDDQLTLFR